MTFGEIPFSPRVKKVIEYGVEEARLLGHNHIGRSISCWVSYVKRKGSAGKSSEVWAQTC